MYKGKTGNHLTRALNVEHILTAVMHKPIAGNNVNNRKLIRHLEKDNGGIQEIIERECAVSCFTVLVERDEAAAACKDGGEEAAACEDGDEDKTCIGKARRMSEVRVSGECFKVVVERDEAAAACETVGGEEAVCEDWD
ncbi:hypothetical protein RHSIM_Rhsim03G0107700 [Rhododendron simsii]|uniref:Uncharacterized protein n=1 Tax=Rhododendron simsii TaxID=118357 RepID=A0A834H3U0_RHOSS|nr:hypothetical protein RHSIM_Rhsim03G0107700 [Rhododendron simsii]